MVHGLENSLSDSGYWQRIRSFSPNARLLIASDIPGSFARGISSAIFNLYLLSLGFTKTFLGILLSVGSFTLAVGALALAPFCYRLGTKNALILSYILGIIGTALQVMLPSHTILLAGSVFRNVGSGLFISAYHPFLTESSTAFERTHLFGASRSFRVASSFLGSIVAGILPGWISILLSLPVDSALAFQIALLTWVLFTSLSLIPLIFVGKSNSKKNDIRDIDIQKPSEFDPSNNPISEPTPKRMLIVKFAIVSGVIGLGAGFMVPFLNVFFWEFYNLPTPIVGVITGLSQGTLAVGLLLSPVLSTKIGKVRTVLLTQGLSLPFLLFLAIVINPYVAVGCYLCRGFLMNVAGPVDRTLQMELVPKAWRPNLSAISSSAWHFTWSISTQITGPLYDEGYYLLPFWFTMACYSTSTILYFLFFRDTEKKLIDDLNKNKKEP